MTKLRTRLARNIRAYCVEKGLSKLKLAALADTAQNCIAMIKGERSFPTGVMFKKIAAVLDRGPFELFSVTPVQKHQQGVILAELAECIEKNYRKYGIPLAHNTLRLHLQAVGFLSFTKNLQFFCHKPISEPPGFEIGCFILWPYTSIGKAEQEGKHTTTTNRLKSYLHYQK